MKIENNLMIQKYRGMQMENRKEFEDDSKRRGNADGKSFSLFVLYT